MHYPYPTHLCRTSIDLYYLTLLSRKLLGQMVPYTLKSPLFANDVDPNKLGTQRAALWMCYWYVC